MQVHQAVICYCKSVASVKNALRVNRILTSINTVNQHWAGLLLGWVTVCGRVNHLGM